MNAERGYQLDTENRERVRQRNEHERFEGYWSDWIGLEQGTGSRMMSEHA